MTRGKELHSEHSVDRVEREIIHQILIGVFRANDYLPSTDRLCETYGVSYQTVRSALGRLVSRGLLAFVAGQGTRVVDLQSSIDLPLLTEVINEATDEPVRRWTLVAQACGFLRFLHKEMADRAATHCDETQLEWARHLIRMLTDRLELKVSRFEVGECEHQISRVLAAASGCITHTAIVNSMRSMFVSEVLVEGSNAIVSINDYWALTEALAHRDAARARQLVDAAWWKLEERAITELKKLGWDETPGGSTPAPS